MPDEGIASFPDPPVPDVLVGTDPEFCVLSSGTKLWRVYPRQGKYPSTWDRFRYRGPSSSRFDHHLLPPCEQDRGMSYMATEGPTCLAEYFQKYRTINRDRDEPWLVGFALSAPLTLLDLTGYYPTRAGCSQEINDGSHEIARKWSCAFYNAFPQIHGLWYRSKMGGRPSIALYERAIHTMPQTPFFHKALASADLFVPLKNAARSLNYKLL